MAILKVNQNVVTPIFDDFIQHAIRSGSPKIARHNKSVLDASDSNAFWAQRNSPKLYLEPTVTYGVGGKLTPIEQQGGLIKSIENFFRPHTGQRYRRDVFDVIGRTDVPMGDWDWPDDIHSAGSVTVNNLNDAYGLLTDVAGKHNQTWDLYLTPGGVRADLMSHRMTPNEFADAGLFDELRIDPMYAQLSQTVNEYPELEGYISQPLFNTRVSQKPRPGDFVAFRLGQVGNAPINPYNKRIIDTYHVGGIQRALLNSQTNPYEDAAKLFSVQSAGLPSSFVDAAQQQLDYYLSNYTPVAEIVYA